MDKLAAFYLLFCVICVVVAILRRSWSAVWSGGMLLVTWILTNTWIHWQNYEIRAQSNAVMDSVCFVICGFLLIHDWRPWRVGLSVVFGLQLVSHVVSAAGDGNDFREYVCVVVRNCGFFLECLCLVFAHPVKNFDPRRDPIEHPEIVREGRAA